MKFKVLSLSIAMLFAQLSVAAPHKQVEACPSIAAVKAAGVSQVVRDSTWGWFGFNTSQYDTNEKWTFTILLGGQSQDEEAARDKANVKLSLLDQVEGPKHSTDHGADHWICAYAGSNQSFAVAVTPAFTQDIAKMFSRYRH